MKAPLSWLKEYVEIKSNTLDLMWRLTEIGLACESYSKVDNEEVLEIEVAPNRPDWLSIIGIAREISVIEKTKLKLPKLKSIPKPSANLPIDIDINLKLVGRYSGITIENVKVKVSPEWMQKRLRLVGLRPINNLVDITNYVMFEMGIPIHVFDYDKFLSKRLSMELSQGGEEFISVDGIKYTLPKDALIIKDGERVIDLCGIKGGENTGITHETKNIFIHIPIYSPIIIRKTSQALKLASDASYIYERGPDLGGTIDSLKRTVDLVLRLAGGKIASDIIDFSNKDIKPRSLSLSFIELVQFLGIEITIDKTVDILKKLNLKPSIKKDKISILIPTYRSDLKIREDIYEEVARIYGYNKFPKTLPYGISSTLKIPYYYDRDFELFLKNIMVSLGFFEINTLALTSREIIENANLVLENHIKIANPVSKEFEYFRTSLIPNLIMATKLNANFDNLKLFEYNKTYFPPLERAQEKYVISGIENNGSYQSIKGVVDLILEKLNISDPEIKPYTVKNRLWHPIRAGVLEKDNKQIGILGEINPKVLNNFGIHNKLYAFELETDILKNLTQEKLFRDIPKYPPQVEDLSFDIPAKIKIGDIIKTIKDSSEYIGDVHFIEKYQNSINLRIYYQHPQKTLEDKEVEEIRNRMMKILKRRFYVRFKN